MNKILIIDDEASVVNFVSMLLRKKGMEVVTARSVEEAKSYVRNIFFDVVITDLRLDGAANLGGFDVITYVQNVSPETKVLVMSGSNLPEIRDEAIRRGASYFFDKPFDLKVLQTQIKLMTTRYS